MNSLYKDYIKTDLLPTLFCPGCANGIVQTAFIHAIDALKIRDDVACVSGIGCSSWIPPYYKLDVMHTIHGRALAFAQGLKLSRPDKKIVVFTGDGDNLAIGGNHFIHAAHRNIDLTVIMVNNYIYGMTGGQKSPTTPTDALTKTSPQGALDEPIDGCELAKAAGATYVARCTVSHPFEIEKAIKEGIMHNGFAFIEVMGPCPIQAGKGLYSTETNKAITITDILKMYKEVSYKAKEGAEDVPGKIKIGTLYCNEENEEYSDKVLRMIKSEMSKGSQK